MALQLGSTQEKITDEELSTLKSLYNDISSSNYNIGEIEVEIYKLKNIINILEEKKKEYLLNNEDINKKIIDNNKTLYSKYGENIQIDINDGTYKK